MAASIGLALQAPPLVLFSLVQKKNLSKNRILRQNLVQSVARGSGRQSIHSLYSPKRGITSELHSVSIATEWRATIYIAMEIRVFNIFVSFTTMNRAIIRLRMENSTGGMSHLSRTLPRFRIKKELAPFLM